VQQREAERKLKKKDYAESTFIGYDSMWRNHIGPSVGHMQRDPKAPGGLRKREAQNLVWEMEAKGLGRGTVVKALVPLRVVYREAFKLDEVSDNPLHDLDLPEVPKKEIVALTEEEVRAYIDALPIRKRWHIYILYCRVIYAVMAWTGMRVGEVKGLRIADIDLPARMIYLCGQWTATGHRWVPKTKHGQEGVVYEIPITDELYPYLAEHLDQLEWDEGFAFGKDASTTFAYATLVGHARRAWGPLGLERINTHLCRHSCGSLLYRNTGRIELVAGLLRHTDPSFTQRTYVHPTSNAVREIAQGLNARALPRALPPAPDPHQLGPGKDGNDRT
jgi:integrase